MVNYKNKILAAFQCFLVCLLPQFSIAEESVEQNALDTQVQQLRKEALDLQRDIGLLEKELLFPPLTRVEVYLSVAPGLEYSLRSVVLEIDGEERSFHIYSDTDMAALKVGGVQSFWEGNVALGVHQLIATFKGADVKGRPLGGEAKVEFKKGKSGLALELQLLAGKNKKTPKFAVKSWGER